MIAFNTILYPSAFRRVPERVEIATDAFVEADADVLCLQ